MNAGVKRGGNGLLLIELFIALMFFSLAAAICLRLFIGAHDFSGEAANRSRAAIESQNIAECFKAAHGDMEKTARMLGADMSGGAISIWFDEDWNRVSGVETTRNALPDAAADMAFFRATLRVTASGSGFTKAALDISQGNNPLVAFDVAAMEAAS